MFHALLLAAGLTVAMTEYYPQSITTNAAGNVLVDFGKDRYGWLEFLDDKPGEYDVRFGEVVRDGSVWIAPDYRGSRYIRSLRVATHKYHGKNRVPFPADPRNTLPENQALPTPPGTGVVLPFRAVEIMSAPFAPTKENIRMVALQYAGFDEGESSFRCSDDRLNRIWDYCKHCVAASTAFGLFVDGDRERLPYEGDTYATQLSGYAMFSDTKIARATFEYLMDHPTWPSECNYSVIMTAWNDYKRTGDTAFVAKWFDRLVKEKLRRFEAREDGLVISDKKTDLTDWPRTERDGFVFCDVNASVNAYHCRTLEMMSELAGAIGRKAEADALAREAVQAKASYNRVFFNAATGFYRDGEGTDHVGLHVNALAVAFGIAPEAAKSAIGAFLATKGRMCSPYFMMYVFEALLASGQEGALFDNLLATGDRSWLGMLDFGATMGMEAWNMQIKPNLDITHSWASIPSIFLARHVLGVDWRDPENVRPHLGPLEWAEGTIPVPGGLVTVRAEKRPDGTVAITRQEKAVRPTRD